MRILVPSGPLKTPFHLTKRPRLSPRSPRQHRKSGTKSSESSNPDTKPNAPSKSPESHPPTNSAPARENANAAHAETTSSPPPPPGSVASSAGAPTVGGPTTAARSLRESVARGPLGRLARGYSRVQEKRPYATQVCSSVLVYLCGDLSAQMLFPTERPQTEERDADGGGGRTGGYDPARTARHLTVGVGSSIPSYHWFMFLHNNFNYASRALSILAKVVIQQVCFTPVFNTYFFSVHSLLSGSSMAETFERLKMALPVSVTNSLKLWPAVTAFSFLYVPPQFRSVFAGCVAVGWQTYLSWLNQVAAREVEEAEIEAGEGDSRVVGRESAMMGA